MLAPETFSSRIPQEQVNYCTSALAWPWLSSNQPLSLPRLQGQNEQAQKWETPFSGMKKSMAIRLYLCLLLPLEKSQGAQESGRAEGWAHLCGASAGSPVGSFGCAASQSIWNCSGWTLVHTSMVTSSGWKIQHPEISNEGEAWSFDEGFCLFILLPTQNQQTHTHTLWYSCGWYPALQICTWCHRPNLP